MDPEILERLRENSGLRLDRDGQFWHEGVLVEHPKVALFFHQGLGRSVDGRATLTVGRTWCYLDVEDVLFRVRQAVCTGDEQTLETCTLRLDDSSNEALELVAGGLAVGDDGVLYARVKNASEWARFAPEAQATLGPYLVEAGGGWALAVRGALVPVGERSEVADA